MGAYGCRNCNGTCFICNPTGTKTQDKNNIKPIGATLLVQPIPAATHYQAGIIIPDTLQVKPLKGTVLAVGRGVVDKEGSLTPLSVKSGDSVYYGAGSGVEVQLPAGGTTATALILKESEILIIETNDNG